MAMVHCEYCCFRVKLTQRGLVPVHYSDTTKGWLSTREQLPCDGSGRTRFRTTVHRCSRPRSGQTCPCCGTKRLTLNKNGRFPAHKAPDGSACSMSDANNQRRR